jgi:hypothetical protein
MNHRLFERAFSRVVSFCGAVAITLALLGGIDHLSQPVPADGQWAQATATRA